MAGSTTRPRRSAQIKAATRAPRRRSKQRSVRKRVSYTEPSSDPEEDGSQDEFELPDAPGPPRRGRSGPPPPKSSLSSSSKKRKAATQGRRPGRPKMPRLGPPMKTVTKKDIHTMKKKPYDIRLTGKTMPWQTLPYHILEVIFDYASNPIIDIDCRATASVAWLLQVSLLCKGFAEPALSALYASPPLLPSTRLRQLIERLEAQNIASFMNYRAKVKNIDIDVFRVVGRKSEGFETPDINRLIALIPQLREVRFVHPAPSRSSGKVGDTNNIIPSLEDAGIRLQGWTWNDHFHGVAGFRMQDWPSAHRSNTFQALRNLEIINYAGPKHQIKLPDGVVWDTDETLVKSLQLLPTLRCLVVRKSPLFDHALHDALPGNLEYLEITQSNISTSDIEPILINKGRNLRTLILNHNRYLSLSWLNSLAGACPKLESLKMDMIYYSPFTTVTNSDPKYPHLLSPHDNPSWPSSLQSLELLHLRKWETRVADNFFWSLARAAQRLKDLRQFKIKASLDESGWRDRVAFRDSWIKRLNDVFLRTSAPPKSYLKSMAPFKEHKARQKHAPDGLRGAKSQHVAITAKKIEGSTDSDSDKLLVNVRRSHRPRESRDYNESNSDGTGLRRPRRRRRMNEYGSSEEDSAIEDEAAVPSTRRTPKKAKEEEEDLYIQGMCDVVDVMIDNLRPTEEQLHESDFLDEEVSGDEDWNGDDDNAGEEGYAW